MTTTAEFIAGFEGYAGRAYWDVNAWRLGYGSDTEGPDQIHVTEGMETTKPRALQNLALRIPQFQHEAIYGKTGMGASTWEKLNDNQKTAITSIVYNYGRLPIIVTPSDPQKTASAIRALQNANGGVNRERRIKEAAFYLAGVVQPAPPAPIPQPPAPIPPFQIPPAPAPLPGLPPISATSAGRRAAEQAYIGALLDQLKAEQAALTEEITAVEQMAADLAKLNPTPTMQLPKPPAIPPPDPPQGTSTMQAILMSMLTNWATSALGTIAGGPSVIDVLQNPANWQHDLPGIATVLLGFFAKDGWVTGGTKQAPIHK